MAVPLPDDDEGEITESRKKDHVDIILADDVRARENQWDFVHLVHEAVPEVDHGAVDLTTRFLGVDLAAPLMIASMTGGYKDAERINANLAEAAAAHGLAMGVGSQRAALVKPATKRSFTVLNDHDVPFVAANIGAPQLVPQPGSSKPPLSHEDVDALVAMIDADALIVHLNYLQEMVQPEGDRAAAGVLAAITELADRSSVPVIAKETGAGMRRASAARLKDAGVAALDVGGLSGTTFAAVELVRARKEGATREARLGALYRDWGLPTPVSVLEAQVGLPVVATGGLRSGLDVARALALGATLGGMASAALTPANESASTVHAFFADVLAELRTACFLTGARAPADLAALPVVVTGPARTWLESLGHDTRALGTRQ